MLIIYLEANGGCNRRPVYIGICKHKRSMGKPLLKGRCKAAFWGGSLLRSTFVCFAGAWPCATVLCHQQGCHRGTVWMGTTGQLPLLDLALTALLPD